MFQSSFASKIIVFITEVLKLLIIKRRKHMLLAVTKHGLFILLREHRDNALEQNLSMLAVTKHMLLAVYYFGSTETMLWTKS